MAFQTGSQVDPRLLDYSGYAQGLTNAATIEASALANLGKEVGASVEKYQKKKLEKEQKGELKKSMLASLESIYPNKEPGELNAIVDGITKGAPTLEALNSLNSMLILEGFKGQQAREAARIKAEEQARKDKILSPKEIADVRKGFDKGGVYQQDGYVIEGGQLFQIVPTEGDFNPFTKDEEKILITEGPIYDLVVGADMLARTPEIDVSQVGQLPPGTGTVLREPGSPNTLELDDMPEAETPTLEQIEDVTTKVNYGEFNVPKPEVKKQEGYRDITATNRPQTYDEFIKQTIQRGKQQPRSRASFVDKDSVTNEAEAKKAYQKYLNEFEYEYPMTFEEYSSPSTGLINYEPGKGITLDFSDRGRFGGSEERYINEYLPRFY